MECEKCGSCVSIEEHHIWPRFMNNEDEKGIKIDLCRSCHQELHQNIIPSVLWSHIPLFGDYIHSWQNKQKYIDAIQRRTKQWIQEKY